MSADLLPTIAAIQLQTTSAGIFEIISRGRSDKGHIDARDAADATRPPLIDGVYAMMGTARRPPAPPDLRLAL